MFFVKATGAILSSTVTMAVLVATFPLVSVTLKVTVFAPTLEQLNDVLSKDKVVIPTIISWALFISATTIEAAPLLNLIFYEKTTRRNFCLQLLHASELQHFRFISN
jgi:hypothetical protein